MSTTTDHGPATDSPSISRGVLAERHADHIVLSIPGTDYRLHLLTAAPVTGEVGKRIRGVIRGQARRIDVVVTGGRYVEPVYGRPRRVQGSIDAVDTDADTVTVRIHDAAAIVCRTDGRQRAADFRVGQFVSLDVTPGATFSPVV